MAVCIKVAFYSGLNLLLRFTLLLHLQDTISLFFSCLTLALQTFLLIILCCPLTGQKEVLPLCIVQTYHFGIICFHNVLFKYKAQQDAILSYSPVPSIYGLLFNVTLLSCDWFPSNLATLNSDMLRIYIIAFLCSCLL